MAKTKTQEAKLKKKEYDKKRREKMKNDPLKLGEMKQKEKQKYLKKKEKVQIKSVKEMSSRQQRLKRKHWKKNSKNYRENIKKNKIIQQFLSPQTPSNSINTDSTRFSGSEASTSRQSAGRKRIRRDKSKLFRENQSLKVQLQKCKRREAKYNMRYQALL